ncbi:MAG: response regulator [Gammaproteobacteria bacterium]
MRTISNVSCARQRIFLNLGHGLKNILGKKSPRVFSIAGTTAQKKILLVEDFPIVREYLAHIFSSIGYQVIPVSTGQKALQKFSTRIDLVFLDIELPDMDGRDVIQAIRKKQASYKRKPAPIIASIATSNVEQSYCCTDADAIFKNGDGAYASDFKRLLSCWLSVINNKSIKKTTSYFDIWRKN